MHYILIHIVIYRHFSILVTWKFSFIIDGLFVSSAVSVVLCSGNSGGGGGGGGAAAAAKIYVQITIKFCQFNWILILWFITCVDFVLLMGSRQVSRLHPDFNSASEQC